MVTELVNSDYPEEDVIKVLQPSVVELPHKYRRNHQRCYENTIGSPRV